MPLTPGTRLGPYEILTPLGVGGMGEVYRAKDLRLGREVAVKVLPGHLSADPEMRARFEREARTVSALNHPHICTLFDVGREGEMDYLVMELIEGETLDERIRRGALPVAEIIRIGIQVADALGRAHREGIVHRDLKPGNVMLSRSGAKLMDFGLARGIVPALFGGADSSGSAALSQSPTQGQPLTTEGILVGTFHYISPEQLEGREADTRSDVWALGCVLYEMASGRRAFDGATQASVISAILKDEPRALHDAAPLVPAGLERVVQACMSKDPDRRWQNASDVGLALELAALDDRAAHSPARPRLEERTFVLSAEHVRQLGERNPRLVGYPMRYIDNCVESDVLVVYLHGVGADSGRFEQVARSSEHRAVAVDLVGFGEGERRRPILGMEDHSQVLRMFLQEIVATCQPKHTVLVGHSAGSDQFLRMIHAEEGAGVDVSALIALGPNVSLETCIASRLYSRLDPTDPGGTLTILKTLASSIDSLEAWLVVQNYLTQTFMKLGTDVGPLRRYAADLVAPFEQPGEPLANWYRAACARIPFVRLVFGREEQPAAEGLISRHLESNVLGEAFTTESLVIEPVHHFGLLDPALIERHVRAALVAIGAQGSAQTG